MILVFYLLAAALIWLSFKSFRGGIAYLRFFERELARPRSEFTPLVTVIAPCRGLERGLKENLMAVIAQDYPDYEVLFVVDDENDDAVSVIEEVSREAAKNAKKTRLVVAGKADGCSQKVENLREAVLHASPGSSAFVFVDSDVRPSTAWLRSLVAPLNDGKIGASTGYRWFISPSRSFASELRSVWNASIASALGPNPGSNFCWGGSMAIRRDVFERIGMRDRWLGTLSDDLAVTRTLKEHGLPIVFVPQAIVASIEDSTFSQMLEFTTRQIKITRVYAPHLWLMSLIGSALFNIVLIAAVAILIVGEAAGNVAVLAAITTILLVTLFSIGKSWLRLKAVRLVLTEHQEELKAQFWTHNTLWLLTPAVFLYNTVTAAFSPVVTWRGTTYVLKSPAETVIIAPTVRQK